MAVIDADAIAAQVDAEKPRRPHRATPAAGGLSPIEATAAKAKAKNAPKQTASEAVVRKALEYPYRAVHDAWATLLHDDYYRLSDTEVDSVIAPAVQLAIQYGYEESVLKISAPIALALALGSIEIDRIMYMMAETDREPEEEFLHAKPEIRTTTPVTVNGRVEEPVTAPVTNAARPPAEPRMSGI